MWSSSLYSHIASCPIYHGQPRQSQHLWSTSKLLILTWSWMRWKEVEVFGLEIFQTRGAKWATFYKLQFWPLSYVSEIWYFLWFDLCFFDAIVFVIDILVFHKQWWPWLMICKFDQKCMWAIFALFHLFDFYLFEVLRSCIRV